MRARKRGRGGAGALLAVLVLSLCFLLTGGQTVTTTTISVYPPNPIEGGNVSLIPKDVPANINNCRWFRGAEATANTIFIYYFYPSPTPTPGTNYTGRETMNSTCSLNITNLAGNYSGTYMFSLEIIGGIIKGEVELLVSEPVSDISITSTPSTIVEDALVTLNCTAAKGTEVSYFWSKGDQVLESDDRVYLSDDNRNITFNTTVREDSGNYTCYANNSFSNSSSTYILNVYYGPSDVFISPNTTYYKTGSSLNLSCTAVSNPPANYTWRFNNETHDGSNWEIDILTVSHSGKYICEAFNEETGLNQSHFLEIKVLEPVSDISITSTPSKVVEDALVTLNCTAAKGTEVSYFWFKGDQVLESDDRVYLSDDNRNITFNTTVREDSGNYTCYANNSFSNSSSTYYLDVYYGPDIPVILPKTPYYAAGTTLRLSCTAASNPLANYTWHFGNGSVSSGSTLTFNLILNDTGFYNCTASNDETDKSSTQSQKVTVVEHLDPPVLTPDSYLPLEKENVTLKCNTSSSAAVSWQKDGKDELPGNAALSENNRTLTLSGFTQKDNGTYTCVASNPRFTAPSNPSVLSMAYGPNNVKINSTRNLTVGLDSTVSLVCSADSNPEAQFRWFVNNTAVTVTKATYNIASVTWGNAGEYRCQANNSRTNLTGTYTVTIIVQVEKPDNPDNPGGLSGGAIAGIVIGCLAAVILIAGLVYYICTKTSVGRTERHASNGTVPSAPGHNQGATDSKPRTGDEDVQYSTLAFNASHPPQPAPVAGQPPDGATIYSEIRKK